MRAQQVGVDPVDDEAVRRQQLQRAGALDHLQRAHPGVELLLRKLSFQRAHATSPERRFHEARVSRECLSEREEKGLRSLYRRTRVAEGCAC